MTQKNRGLAAKTDYNVPMFSFKSALLIILTGIMSTIILPSLLANLGLDKGWAVIVLAPIFMGFAVAFSQFFIERKRGKCKQFWYTYLFFGLMFLIIAFFWTKLGVFL